MPVSGFKVGEVVMTPAGKMATVENVIGLYARVRYDDGHKAALRQAALRVVDPQWYADEYCLQPALWSANPQDNV